MRRRPLVALAAVLVVAGCSSGTTAKNSSGAGNDLTAQTPPAQGSLASVTWNLPAGEPASLDYSLTWDIASGNTVLANLCDTLMRQKPGGGYSPSLATSVTQPNPTTYVYQIRQGVKFTDGTPMTAQDVAFSLQRQMNPKTASYWALWFQYVKSVAVISPSQVTVTLTKPDAVFGEMMATAAGSVVEKAYVQHLGSKYGTPSGGVMCTGPFSLEKWTPGGSISLKANPDYWDRALAPKVGSVNFTFLRDEAAITNGLTTGSIDGTWEAPLASLAQLKASSAGTLYQNTGTRTLYLTMASFAGALKDPRIRQALQKSVDYAGIVGGLLHGAAQPAASVAGPATWGYSMPTFTQGNANLPQPTQDIAAAKALVSGAGAPSIPVTLGYDAGDATATAVAASIQNSATQIGLNVTLKGLPTATYASVFYDPKARRGLDAFVASSSADVADPDEVFLQVVSSSPYNYTGYKNSLFDSSMEQAQSETDPAKRAALVVTGETSAAKIVQIFLPIATYNEAVYLNKKVTGVPVSTFSSLYYPWAATLGAAQ